MKKRGLPVASIIFLFLVSVVSVAQAQSAPQTPEVTEVNLAKALEGNDAVTLEAGQGVVLQFGPADPEDLPHRVLTVLDGQTAIKHFADAAFYVGYARVEMNPAVYWVIALFTGGAHCCAEYDLFCRPGPGQPVRYLGMTGGHNGEPQKLAQAFVVKNNNLYFKDLDNRFDFFHGSNSGSRLINFPNRYYLITHTAIIVANTFFKDQYLQAAPVVEAEIAQAANSGRSNAPAILKQNGSGRGFEALQFSDELGQLLVKRTILLLYARENIRAWQELQADVKKYYQTTRWLPELKRDIQRLLASRPY